MKLDLDLESLINKQLRETVDEQIRQLDVAALIEPALQSAVDAAVARMVETAVRKLLNERDLSGEVAAMVQDQITNVVDRYAAQSVALSLSRIDIPATVKSAVGDQIENIMSRMDFPDESMPAKVIRWDDYQISGNRVSGGLIRDFNSTGIEDQASEVELTVMDGMIVAERRIISPEIEAESATITGNLILSGDLTATGPALLQLERIAGSVVDDRIRSGIDISDGSITDNGKKILDKGELGPSVIVSNLRRLGTLSDLRVSGSAIIADTLAVMPGKLGINTEEPVGAMTLWDEGSDLTISKIGPRRTFVGSTRGCDLVFGTDFDDKLVIGKTEVTIKDAVRIGGVRFSIADTIPERRGEPNEIVYVTGTDPRFYLCSGGTSWRAL
jgi:hypothetical protein